MSEFTDVWQVRASGEATDAWLAGRVSRVWGVEGGAWVSVVVPERVGGDVEWLRSAPGPLVRYRFAEDHGWSMEVVERGVVVARYEDVWDDSAGVDVSAPVGWTGDVGAAAAVLGEDVVNGLPAGGVAAPVEVRVEAGGGVGEVVGWPKWRWVSPDYDLGPPRRPPSRHAHRTLVLFRADVEEMQAAIREVGIEVVEGDDAPRQVAEFVHGPVWAVAHPAPDPDNQGSPSCRAHILRAIRQVLGRGRVSVYGSELARPESRWRLTLSIPDRPGASRARMGWVSGIHRLDDDVEEVIGYVEEFVGFDRARFEALVADPPPTFEEGIVAMAEVMGVDPLLFRPPAEAAAMWDERSWPRWRCACPWPD